MSRPRQCGYNFPPRVLRPRVHLLLNQESIMPNPNITFDHVHLISKNVSAAAQWYVDKLGAEIVKSAEVRGAPQVYLEIGGGSMLIVRGERPGETNSDKAGSVWGVDHFGVRVKGDFHAFCAGLKAKGVVFSAEPRDNGPTTQLAFINAPDGVSVELLNRKDAA
jgi:catechol 2,3-dioxygenase-like lactoylglutathione lyase family enzyme